MHVVTICEAEDVVIERLKELRREVESKEEIAEKAAKKPTSSLTKHQLEVKVKNIAKQNVGLKQ
jgi:hypothetical protein